MDWFHEKFNQDAEHGGQRLMTGERVWGGGEAKCGWPTGRRTRKEMSHSAMKAVNHLDVPVTVSFD